MRRRPAAVLLAALVAVTAVFTVTTPQSVLAAPSGLAGLIPDTTCIPLDGDPDTPESRDVGVRGHGFEPDTTVDIYIHVTGVESFPEPTSTVQTDAFGAFETSVGLALPYESLEYVISAVTRGGEGINGNANIAAPCPPTVVVTPTCVAPDQPFDMSFVVDGFSPGGSIQVGLIVPEGYALIVSDPLTADDNGHLEYSFSGVGPLPAGRYQAAAVEGAGRNSMASIDNSNVIVAQTPVELPCVEPQISVDPDCASVGAPQDTYAVTVSGAGFRYGEARVAWDVGGSEETFPIDQIGDDGTFSVSIQPFQRPRGRITVRVTQTFPYTPPDGGESDYLLGSYPTFLYPPRVAETRFRVPCRPTATPVTATPLMDLDPDCASPALVGDPERRYQIGVAASGLVPGPVDIVFDAGAAASDVTPPEQFPGEVGNDGVLLSQTITPLARPVGEYRVAILQGEASVIERVFRVPCTEPDGVLRVLRPECGAIAPGVPESYSIRLRGRGWYPGTLELTFDQKGTPEVQSATVGDDGTFDAQLPGGGRDRGEYTVLVRQRDARGVVLRASRVFTVPCVEPTLTIEPLSGPTGYTTTVTGTDFPPGTIVTLTWDRGITAATPIEVTADAAGAFETIIFLLPHDIPGQRVLTAGTPADPGAFPEVAVDYLVTVGSGQPPGGPDDPGGVIFRR